MLRGTASLLAAASAVSGVFASQKFGPSHCVSVLRDAEKGTCVIRTDCVGQNIDDTEFAFTCQLPNMLQKHSFGKGGFDAQEEFDTGVKCDECGLPLEEGQQWQKKAPFLRQSSKTAAADEPATAAATDDKKEETAAAADDKKEDEKKEEDKKEEWKPSKVKYGPENCVSTWLNPTDDRKDGELGVCQVETGCTNVTDSVFETYPVGLICVDKDNTPVRHLFGTDSFEKNETFNTLIRCTACLGLDNISETVTLEATVKGLSTEIYELKEEVEDMKKKLPATTAAADTNAFLANKDRASLNDEDREDEDYRRREDDRREDDDRRDDDREEEYRRDEEDD